MSDGMVTLSILKQACERTSAPPLVIGELKRMRSEEPSLHREVRASIEMISRQVRTASGPDEAGDTGEALAELLAARFYAALRLGHEKLWRKTSGIADPFGPAAALSEALKAEVKALISGGRKTEAIRKLRAAAHLGLKEAREIVDRIEGELQS